MAEPDILCEQLCEQFASQILASKVEYGEVTIEVAPESLVAIMRELRDAPQWHFEQLIDVAGVDYATYGQDEWTTEQASSTGFSRGVTDPGVGRLGRTGIYGLQPITENTGRRLAAVYHLLSLKHGHRLRVRCFATDDDFPVIPSLVGVWGSANWPEREAFDLYGIIFEGHPDLRRILTDYGFVGHPFRKDFPMIGDVEPYFDEDKGRVVYVPVQIEPRVLTPRVIRDDNRQQQSRGSAQEGQGNG
ncbi:NADH-quinone oxidoreductase subunit C [Halorhodospira halochloris]|uniref:NADH-quinone oxidoreductase subunit C n=1 Tax=Halorhodospira halochloris TaxID=1052 RepID=UPI001EE8B547|nr:NADH-quinone oxidoreductase subunit C [Halorhodospira halochloris]MCG5548473.1 NADH-quinone oxidoreductase subunit C [Halorhodospira halochloris]